MVNQESVPIWLHLTLSFDLESCFSIFGPPPAREREIKGCVVSPSLSDRVVRLIFGALSKHVRAKIGLSCRTLLPSARQHPSYRDCLEVKREYYQNCSVLGCVTQCLQPAAHLYEQFLQAQQIGFVTLGPLHVRRGSC